MMIFIIASVLLLFQQQQQTVQGFRGIVIPRGTGMVRTSSLLRCESQLMGSEGLKTITSVTTTMNDADGLNEEVAKVAMPALAAYIVEPALSVVDTFFVGKATIGVAATLGLAGMGINTALFNIIAAATAPLATGTAAVISKLRGEEELLGKNITATDSTVGSVFMNGIAMAASIGALLSATILLGGRTFLRRAFELQPGSDFLSVTASYFHIRCLSLPSVLVNLVLFGFSIAVQDVLAPVLSIVIAFWVNVLGDFLLCGVLGYGLVGAAIATTVSSYLGSLLALRYLVMKFKLRLPRTVKGDVSWSQLFDRRRLKLFFSASAPLVVGSMANTLTYSSGARITSFTAAAGASVAMQEIAAHQVVMGLWWFLSWFASPLFLTGQAILPKDISASKQGRAKKLIRLLAKLAVMVALITTAANLSLLLGAPSLFTQNVAVQQSVRSVWMQSGISLLLINLATVLDGVFVGCGKLKEYVQAGCLSTAVAWLYYSLIAIPRKQGLVGTWNGLVLFCLTRFIYYVALFPRLYKSLDEETTTATIEVNL